MAIDLPNFILSLAVALQTPAGATVGTNLFALEAIEGNGTTDPYAVLLNYGGPVPEELVPVPQISVQCMVTGKSTPAALRLGQKMFEALYEEGDEEWPGVPRNGWDIPAKKIVEGQIVDDAETGTWEIILIIPSQPPGLVGRDESNRSKVSFNFDVRINA